MEKMLKRVGLCSGKRTIDSTDSTAKQQQGGEAVDSKAVTKTDTDADKEPEGKGDPVRDLPLCDVVNSNEWGLRQRLAGGVDGAEGVVASGELLLTEDETDGRVACEQVDRRCWRRSRVLFHFQLDSHIMEFKPRALTRRLCGGKKHDNELYRSNSFKFERFERKEVGPLQKQISLCDDYAIPVDFVNKRPRSVGGGLANWTTPSPNGDTVEVIETYSDPRDSKAYLRPGDEPSGAKLYTSPDRDYSQPYPVAPPPPPSPPPLPSADPRAGEEEPEEAESPLGEPVAVSLVDECVSLDEGVYEAVGEDQKQNQLGVCFKDDDSISGEVGEDIFEAETHFLTVNPPQRRHPSPYYYADLFREEEEDEDEKIEEEEEDKEGVREEEAPIQDTQVPQREHNHHKHHHQHKHHHSHHHQHKHHHRHHHHHRHKHRIKEHRHSCEAEEGAEEGEEDPSDEVLPSHLLSDAAVGTSTVEVERSASGGVVVAQGSGVSGGPEAGYGGGGPAPAFLAACLLRDWDLIFTTPASATGTAARSSTPSGTKGVARGLRACSCRGGRCVRGEEDEDGEAECCEVPLEEGDEEDMSGRQRHLYETAFDCKVRRSQDDLDEVDRVSNHPVLRMLPVALVRAAAAVSPRSSRSVPTKEVTSTPPKERRKLTLTRSETQPATKESKRPDERCAEEKAEVERPADLPSFQTPPSLKGPVGSGHAPSPPPLRGYAPSPPSTAPLPTKFHNRSSEMNSLCSAPDLPAGRTSSPARTKDSRLPVKSRRGRHGTNGPILEFKDRPAEEEMEEEEDERIEVREAVEGRSVVVVGRPSRAHCRPTLVPSSGGARPKYSSTESMATSSSAMSSLESIRSSTSEGNRSTSSSGSRRSSSLSSHSSDSGSARLLDLHRLHLHHHHHHHHGSSQSSQQLGHQTGHPQLHILSPISDKSQEPASETSDNNRNNNSQGASPEERLSSPAAVDNLPTEPTPVPTLISDHSISPPRPEAPISPQTLLAPTPWEGAPKLRRRVLVLQNKNLLNRALVQAAVAAATSSSGEAEVQGSDSGISIESSSQGQGQVSSMGSGDGGVTMGLEDLRALPFDMPKLRRRLAADASGSSSTSVASNSRPDDLRALPFDMPKLRRRLRQQQSADGLELDGSSGVSQASSSQSVLELEIHSRNSGKPLLLGQLPGATSQPQGSIGRPNLTLNLCGTTSGPSLPHSRKKRPGLSLELGCSALSATGEPVDVSVPLERQGWYHGAITRVEAESVLRLTKEGSYLVRNSESTRQDYSLSLKSARGFMHMRIQQNKESGRYILGQFSQPFSSIPEMIHFYTINRLPIKGAEHMCLLHPVIEQLL